MMRQLPSVPNTLCGDDGDYCFSSKIFNKMFPHQIELKEVVRQKETDLIKAIEECSMGNVSPHTVTFIRSLNRPLPEKVSIVTPMLFSTNELVDDFNRKSIIEQPGQMYEFIATDTGEKRYLDKMTVSKVLWLNIGVPVILMRNLTDKLVNGLQGYVTGITEDGPVVKFAGNEVPIKKVKCTVFSPLKNMDVAVREQYPLKLAFAISIHKSQGMTLDRVEVNCKGIFIPGQFGVALGRYRNSEGVRVVNFEPSVCISQPSEVKHFLLNITNSPCLQDKSFCQAKRSSQPQKLTITVPEMVATDDAEYDDATDNEEFDDEFDKDIRQIDELHNQNDNIELELLGTSARSSGGQQIAS